MVSFTRSFNFLPFLFDLRVFSFEFSFENYTLSHFVKVD